MMDTSKGNDKDKPGLLHRPWEQVIAVQTRALRD